MVHVCLINSLFPPDAHGGAENYVLRTAKALQARGHDVSVITAKAYDGTRSLRPERTTYEGLPVWRFYPSNVSYRKNGTGDSLPAKGLWHALDTANPPAARAVGQVLDRTEPDVVHTNNLMGISTAIARPIQRRDVRHVHTLHDYSLICPKSNLLREWTAPDDELVVCEDPPIPCRMLARGKRALLGSPDMVTAPSQHVIDVHRQHGFFDDTDCQRVRLGVESVAEQPPSVPEQPSILYVGKHHRSKGLDTLFAAAEHLPDVEFHLCGTGPYAETSERHAERQDNVTYHGFVPDSELERLRREASLGVVPSIWMENSPLTIYESFAAGLPIVGSDIGGIPELVTPGRTGALFDPEDASGLAAEIETIVRGETELEAMRTNALDWAAEHTIGAHVDRLSNAIYVL